MLFPLVLIRLTNAFIWLFVNDPLTHHSTLLGHAQSLYSRSSLVTCVRDEFRRAARLSPHSRKAKQLKVTCSTQLDPTPVCARRVSARFIFFFLFVVVIFLPFFRNSRNQSTNGGKASPLLLVWSTRSDPTPHASYDHPNWIQYLSWVLDKIGEKGEFPG